MRNVKQVIIIRKDLKMNSGKLNAQKDHASLGVFINMLKGIKYDEKFIPEIENEEYNLSLNVKVGSDLDVWLRESFKKIYLWVNSEEELLEIYNKAKELNLPAVKIVDSGLTCFNNTPTTTCVGIGPVAAELVDKITGHLKLV